MSEKGTDNIRKIYFKFRDIHFWSIELRGESVVTVDHAGKNSKSILETDKQNGLVEHTIFGDVPFLSSEEVSKLFHTWWSRAAGCENYDKSEWKELSRILLERGFDV